jgi:phage N-6-adenine-methyltransferase
MVQRALFSSATDEWETPRFLFDGLDAEFGFDLDVSANHINAKCKRYFTRTEDGLRQKWEGVCWMNPPYGRDIERWMQKAFESASAGALVVCLVPVRTDTRWWHKFAMRGEIRYLRGRLRFGGSKNSAPFPSALVIFRPPKCG